MAAASRSYEALRPSPKMTRDRARPRPADPGHSRYLPRRHIIAHDQKQSLHRRYHGDYINSGSRLDLDASEKRVPAPLYIRFFSSSPYTAARPPRTRATRPRARRRKTFGGLAAFQPRRRPRARAERGPARLRKNSVASTTRPRHATATRRRTPSRETARGIRAAKRRKRAARRREAACGPTAFDEACSTATAPTQVVIIINYVVAPTSCSPTPSSRADAVLLPATPWTGSG